MTLWEIVKDWRTWARIGAWLCVIVSSYLLLARIVEGVW
jgi:hypothetical protein